MKKPLLSLTFLIFMAALTSCGSSDGPDGLELAGTWNGTAQTTQNSCGPNPAPVNFTTQINQSGNTITFENQEGTEFTATLNGNNLTFSGSATRTENGCTAVVNYNGTATVTNTRIQGEVTSTIQISGGICIPITCTVKVNYTMTR